MPTATRNRPKPVSVSKTALVQVGSLLQDLSAKPKEEMSLREAIDELREPIQSALAKGYSYDEIVAILGKKGIKTTSATVKRYISLGNPRKRKPRGSAAKSGTRKSNSGSEVESPTEAIVTPLKTAGRASAAQKEVAPKAAPAKGQRKSAAASADSAAQTKVKTTRTSETSKVAAAKPATRGRKKLS